MSSTPERSGTERSNIEHSNTDRSTHLIELVERFRQARVWVAGDLMLDEYLVGSVERISPEAPVPVVTVEETFFRLGGAANVARSISKLGVAVRLFGVVGNDPIGDQLLGYCAETAIEAGDVQKLPSRPTTRKTRILGLGQQLLRLDWEHTDYCSEDVCEPLMARLEGRSEGQQDDEAAPTALILADYGKGFLSPASIGALIDAAAAHGVPSLVDPIGTDFEIYRGCTVLKPNLRELGRACGRSLGGLAGAELIEVTRELALTHNVGSVVVTMGERGMLVVPQDGEAEYVPGRPREVYDVTGAGDTVIALLALGLSVGATLGDAARIANTAAGLVVKEVGAAAVDMDQLTTELGAPGTAKEFTSSALGERVSGWRQNGRKIAFANGCFDVLHVGHLSLLREAAQLADILVVGVNSDASVERLKGPGRPVMPERDRVAMLAALEFVDAVAIFEQDTPLELIEVVQPDFLVKGQDYRVEDVVGREIVEARGGRVHLVQLKTEHSTSLLLDRIRQS